MADLTDLSLTEAGLKKWSGNDADDEGEAEDSLEWHPRLDRVALTVHVVFERLVRGPNALAPGRAVALIDELISEVIKIGIDNSSPIEGQKIVEVVPKVALNSLADEIRRAKGGQD